MEKNNDVAKGLYFRNSNNWDATTDILANERRLTDLKYCERTKRKYIQNKLIMSTVDVYFNLHRKRDDLYWKCGGIQETRRKRPRIRSAIATQILTHT